MKTDGIYNLGQLFGPDYADIRELEAALEWHERIGMAKFKWINGRFGGEADLSKANSPMIISEPFLPIPPFKLLSACSTQFVI
jgi:hypothetical protein